MDHRIETAVALIRADLCRTMTIAELADRVNLSISHLRHLFKAETGMSPAQYLKAQRLRKAKDLLETTFLSIKEIMRATGASDKSRFAQDFRKAYGLTPTRYREQSRLAVACEPLQIIDE
ncbi:MAG: helix-turn-helix domain-containing protein [Acidobacteria bacterium]|nr:helix-turn-helix domain-containing protein [Acidobacteriota bacterium]